MVLSDLARTIGYSSWDEYCDAMSRNKTWGDQITLLAAAELFKRRVVVADGTQLLCIPPKGATEANPILFLAYVEGNYDSVQKLKKEKVPIMWQY